MIRHLVGDVPYYGFEVFDQHPQVLNAVFTRLGSHRAARWGLNVGHTVGDTPEAVEENHRLIYQTLAVEGSQVVTARQVHGNQVALVDRRNCDSVVPDSDALITAEPGVALMLRFADCLPIFLYDPCAPAVGLGHAGWQGTAAEIASRMVSAMIETFGTDPTKLIAALGPAVGPCCYEVGAEVVEAVGPTLSERPKAILARGNGHYAVDLWEANRQQLAAYGVTQIEVGRICTACHAHEFFSHRAEGGQTGRFAALIAIQETV